LASNKNKLMLYCTKLKKTHHFFLAFVDDKQRQKREIPHIFATLGNACMRKKLFLSLFYIYYVKKEVE